MITRSGRGSRCMRPEPCYAVRATGQTSLQAQREGWRALQPARRPRAPSIADPVATSARWLSWTTMVQEVVQEIVPWQPLNGQEEEE